MIFGIRRAAAALAIVLSFCSVMANIARADLFHHDIPRVVDAVDTSTGEPIMAPPIPYGHYAKDPLGHFASKGSMIHAKLGGLLHPNGKGAGNGFGDGDNACGNCGGSGLFGGKKCSLCGGSGLFNHDGSGLGGLGHGGNGLGHGSKGLGHCGNGLFGGHGHGHKGAAGVAVAGPLGSSQAAPSAQGTAVAACSEPGCGLFKGHNKGCGFCGGTGLCGGKGCGACGGMGLLGHGRGCGDPGCGDNGCGGGHGFGKGKLCGNCGGKGCGLCAGLHSKIAGAKAGLGGLINHGPKVKYFVGPGGPVPITPGYVPYVNVTRSPRDFFAFPPFTQ